MIIDIVKSNGVPFRCNKCNAYFAWKPDKQGVCSVLMERKCKEIECKYYKPAEKKCPECGSNDLSKISTIVYKIMREIRR